MAADTFHEILHAGFQGEDPLGLRVGLLFVPADEHLRIVDASGHTPGNFPDSGCLRSGRTSTDQIFRNDEVQDVHKFHPCVLVVDAVSRLVPPLEVPSAIPELLEFVQSGHRVVNLVVLSGLHQPVLSGHGFVDAELVVGHKGATLHQRAFLDFLGR